MNLDLNRVLKATRDGQWSVYDFDWSTPVQAPQRMTGKMRRQAALALLFTAGLERQASKVFRLNAKHVDDPVAKKIFELFAIDELRHADAEVLMAERLGATWRDLPLPVRLFFKGLEGDWFNHGEYAYRIAGAIIVLFELALDSILIATLKSLMDDPLQSEVFRRIDQDESRHLAMDYWLLNRLGLEPPSDLRPSAKMVRTLGKAAPFAPIGILVFLRSTAAMQRSIRPEFLTRYWERVQAVKRKAPNAEHVPAFQNFVDGLGALIGFFSEHPRLFRSLFA